MRYWASHGARRGGPWAIDPIDANAFGESVAFDHAGRPAIAYLARTDLGDQAEVRLARLLGLPFPGDSGAELSREELFAGWRLWFERIGAKILGRPRMRTGARWLYRSGCHSATARCQSLRDEQIVKFR